MKRLCVFLLLCVFAASAEAQDIVFPEPGGYAEGDPCRTPSGGSGTCSRSCGHTPSFEEPAKCGTTDFTLFCCDTTLDVSPEDLDVSPPHVTFDCSTSRPQVIRRPTSTNNGAAGGKVPAVGSMSGQTTWPWMALIGGEDDKGKTWFCAGMLINEQWVLSQTSCFQLRRSYVVRLGEYDYNDDFDGAAHQDFKVVETVYYPEYSFPESYHELILVKLDSKVTLQTYISPVCLPWGAESKNNITGHKAKLLTYNNRFNTGTINSVQKEIEITVFPVAHCDRNYSNLPRYLVNWPRGMGQETLCAGDPAGVLDACQGDSGASLVTQDTSGRIVVAGIVSQGYGCGHKDYPGLYVNLRYSPYLAWIKKVAFSSP